MNKAIEFKNVSYTYLENDVPALRKVSLEVEEGEFVGIIGPNSSGKSTICRAISGLIPHSYSGQLDGEIIVKGYKTQEVKTVELAKFVGMVFADPEAQLSQNTVWEEIAFGPANLGIPKVEILKRVEELLALLKIEGLRNKSPFTLSGGEQQRVAIASVLAMQPDILVLDEPTSNLDPQGTAEVFAAVRSLNEEQHITVVMVEHEVELLAEFANRILLMNKGEIVLDGTPSCVFRSTEIVRQTGLNVPQVTEVIEILDKEYNVWGQRPYPLTVEEAIKLINLSR